MLLALICAVGGLMTILQFVHLYADSTTGFVDPLALVPEAIPKTSSTKQHIILKTDTTSAPLMYITFSLKNPHLSRSTFETIRCIILFILHIHLMNDALVRGWQRDEY